MWFLKGKYRFPQSFEPSFYGCNTTLLEPVYSQLILLIAWEIWA